MSGVDNTDLLTTADKCLLAVDTLMYHHKTAIDVQKGMAEFLESNLLDYKVAIERLHDSVDAERRKRVYETRNRCRLEDKSMDAEACAFGTSAGQLQACAAMCDSGFVTGFSVYAKQRLANYAERLLAVFMDVSSTAFYVPAVCFADDVDLLCHLDSIEMKSTPSPGMVAAAIAACDKAQRIRHAIHLAEMSALNTAVDAVYGFLPEVASLYCVAVKYLALLCGVNSDSNRITAAAATPSTAGLVIAVMKAWPQLHEVQEEGAKALTCLTFNELDPINFEAVLEYGGLDILYAAADAHMDSRKVQFAVCTAMYNMATYSVDGCEALRGGRAAEVATRAMETYSDGGSLDNYVRCLLRRLSGTVLHIGHINRNQ